MLHVSQQNHRNHHAIKCEMLKTVSYTSRLLSCEPCYEHVICHASYLINVEYWSWDCAKHCKMLYECGKRCTMVLLPNVWFRAIKMVAFGCIRILNMFKSQRLPEGIKKSHVTNAIHCAMCKIACKTGLQNVFKLSCTNCESPFRWLSLCSPQTLAHWPLQEIL